MVAAAVPVTYALSAVSSRWFPPQPEQFDLYRALIPSDWKAALGGFVAVVVFVPLAEEMLFRRLILDALRQWLPGWLAAVFAGGLFGLAHGAPWMFLPIAVLGTLLGWLVVRTESLTLAWLGHGLFNLVAYVELCSTHDVRAERLERWSASPFVWLPCLVVLGGWIVAEWRGRKTTPSDGTSAGTQAATEPAGPGVMPSPEHEPDVAMGDSRPSQSNDPRAGGNDAVW
jgi:membrane protease YdiL (CAAX protease family)